MASHILIFGLILTVWVVNILGCFEVGELCTNHNQCCNHPNGGCWQTHPGSDSRCRGDGLHGSECEKPVDCSKMSDGTCENGTCVCRSGYKLHKINDVINRKRCKPINMDPRVTWHDKK